MNRRQLLGRTAAGVGAGAASRAGAADRELPKRVLGRTGFKTSTLGLGMAPIGMNGHSREEAERLVNEALDLGINYVDVAPSYADAEEKLGPVAAKRRDGIFLVTKTNHQKKAAILEQIRTSLRRLRTDRIDAVHLHNFGDFTLKEALEDENGGLAALREARRRGYIRFIGLSGHLRPWMFTRAIATGEFDLVMPAMNFVDRHTYNFEEKVLPESRKHQTAVVAMKVLGGAIKMEYARPTPAMLREHYDAAIRYALGLEGVCAVVLGLSSSEEIRRAAAAVGSYRPLLAAERDELLARGRDLAKEWGAHFGPVV